MPSKELTYKEVWNTLSKVDCSDHIEKKMNLSYLSWAWAWGILMKHYPDAQYGFYEQKDTGVPYVQMPDGSAEIRCRITIGNLSREMWLPVMDNRYNAIKNPSARQVSDTKMRCLVKTMAMFGLGHHIYGGEDLVYLDEKKDSKSDEDVDIPDWVTEGTEEARQEKNINQSNKKSPDASDEEKLDNPKDDDYENPEWADLFFKGFMITAELYETKKALRGAINDNALGFGKIKLHHPDKHKQIMDEIKEFANKLPEGEEKKDG
tara:strand:- start:350 stop:1138 length:789 start_codon:yes stop_codon:yes gene_type:complete